MPDVSSNDSGARLPATPHEWKALYLGTFPAPDLKDLLRRIGVGLPQADGLAMRREAFRQTQALEAQLDEAQEANRMLTARCDELADALREALRYMPDEACGSGECDACWDTCRAMVDADRYRRALARVDALTGGER